MLAQVQINGDSFLPIKEAAKLVLYSRDYVARLAREQKIVAMQVERQWYVDTVSLKNFAEAAELEQTVRHHQLSLERKREQITKQKIVLIKSDVKKKARSIRLEAQLVATFVLGFGLMTGAGIYTASALFSLQSKSVAQVGEAMTTPVVPVANIAVSTSTIAEDIFAVAKPQATTLLTTIVEQPLFVDEAETRAMSASDSEGVFLLSRNGEVRNAEAVKALFSDDVAVKFLDDNTGVITYTPEKGKANEFMFVSVPAETKQNILPEKDI